MSIKIALQDLLRAVKELDERSVATDSAIGYAEQELARAEGVASQREVALQAQLDRLMLEYCPDEMTPEQMDNWAKHQKAVEE